MAYPFGVLLYCFCYSKDLFQFVGYQAQYPGQWPPSVPPGQQQQFTPNQATVNNAQSLPPQSVSNSLGPSPTSTPPRRSPVNQQPG